MLTPELTTHISPSIDIKKPKIQRLQGFLTLVVFLSIALPASITGSLLIYNNLQTNIAEKSKNSAERYADLLQGGMSVPLWNVSPALGKPLMDSVMIDSAVLSIKVQSIDHEAFLTYENPAMLTSTGKNQIRILRPVFYARQEMGQVELIYSLAQAKEHAAKETRRLALVIFLQLLTSLIVLSYFLRKRVILPLVQLSQFAAGITHGDLKTAAPKLLPDEFGDLSGQMEIMRSSLQHNISSLEERVNERTAELSQINSQLTGTLEQLKHTQGHLIQSEKLAALGSLVAGVAHELNTPIGNGLTVATSLAEAITLFKAQLVNGVTRTGLQQFIEDVSDGSDLICRNLEKASELVSGFKQVAMDRTSAQRRRFNMLQLLQETQLTMTPLFRHTDFHVIIDCPPDIELDSYPGPLGQAIANFLNNALIHAFAGRDSGQITISVTATEDTPAAVIMRIRDNGVGIAPEHISKIFDPFFTTKLGAGGNGLGMHIVHNIVTALLGGQIRVQSILGQGAEFILYLPLEAPSEAPADPSLANEFSDQHPTSVGYS